LFEKSMEEEEFAEEYMLEFIASSSEAPLAVLL
jgi:hypothetical protein